MKKEIQDALAILQTPQSHSDFEADYALMYQYVQNCKIILNWIEENIENGELIILQGQKGYLHGKFTRYNASVEKIEQQTLAKGNPDLPHLPVSLRSHIEFMGQLAQANYFETANPIIKADAEELFSGICKINSEGIIKGKAPAKLKINPQHGPASAVSNPWAIKKKPASKQGPGL